MIFTLGPALEEETKQCQYELEGQRLSRVFVTTENRAKETLEQAKMIYEGEVQLSDIGFCKVENQQECMIGSFYIPKLLDLLGKRYAILFFVNEKNIVLVDNSDFSYRLIMRLKRKKTRQEITKEKFLYLFITEFIRRDLDFLIQYEKRLIDMEEQISQGHVSHFLSDISPIRKELLTLRSYYDELMDLGKELETNENGFFTKKQTKYFGTVTDRADRLMSKTVHLLEYAQQVRDAYQSYVDARQNANMQFLTVISTIFFPLTLITGWYGMNFENMPELREGYPGVVVFSVLIVLLLILFFKKKKML